MAQAFFFFTLKETILIHRQIYIFFFLRVQPLTRPSGLDIMAFFPDSKARTNSEIYTPKRDDEHSRPSHMRSPPPPPPPPPPPRAPGLKIGFKFFHVQRFEFSSGILFHSGIVFVPNLATELSSVVYSLKLPKKIFLFCRYEYKRKGRKDPD